MEKYGQLRSGKRGLKKKDKSFIIFHPEIITAMFCFSNSKWHTPLTSTLGSCLNLLIDFTLYPTLGTTWSYRYSQN